MKTKNQIKLEERLPKLSNILKESLLDNKLQIAKVNHICENFKDVCQKHPKIKKSKYVIFSQFMKQYHNYETFIFIDDKGELVELVSTHDFWLFDMINIYNISENKKVLI